MSTANQPTNQNFLSQLGFNFKVKKLPHVNYFAQTINLTGINLGETIGQPSPFVTIPIPGDHLQFNEMNVTFRIDEDFANYLEIHNWMYGLGFPENFTAYKTLDDADTLTPGGGDGLKSDGTLMLLNSAMNPNVEIIFRDMYPVSLSDVEFTTTGTDVDYVLSTISFRYQFYTIRKLP